MEAGPPERADATNLGSPWLLVPAASPPGELSGACRATGDGSVASDTDPTGREPPSRRRSDVRSDDCTTWATAWWVRSSDCMTRAVAVVATTLPRAMPTMVPFSPKNEAISAARTAPVAEAATCLELSRIRFTGGRWSGVAEGSCWGDTRRSPYPVDPRRSASVGAWRSGRCRIFGSSFRSSPCGPTSASSATSSSRKLHGPTKGRGPRPAPSREGGPSRVALTTQSGESADFLVPRRPVPAVAPRCPGNCPSRTRSCARSRHGPMLRPPPGSGECRRPGRRRPAG